MFLRVILEVWAFPFVRKNIAIKFLIHFMKINMLEVVTEEAST